MPHFDYNQYHHISINMLIFFLFDHWNNFIDTIFIKTIKYSFISFCFFSCQNFTIIITINSTRYIIFDIFFFLSYCSFTNINTITNSFFYCRTDFIKNILKIIKFINKYIITTINIFKNSASYDFLNNFGKLFKT